MASKSFRDQTHKVRSRLSNVISYLKFLKVLGIVPILLTLQLRLNLSAYDNATAGTRNGTLQFNSDVPVGPSSAYDVELDGRQSAKAVKLNASSTDHGTLGDSLRFETKDEGGGS